MFLPLISCILVWFKNRILIPGPVAQSVLTPTADTEIANLISARSHTLVEIDHEIISTAILLFPMIQDGVVVSYMRKYLHEVLANLLVKLGWEKVWLDVWPSHMTIAVHLDLKNQN